MDDEQSQSLMSPLQSMVASAVLHVQPVFTAPGPTAALPISLRPPAEPFKPASPSGGHDRPAAQAHHRASNQNDDGTEETELKAFTKVMGSRHAETVHAETVHEHHHQLRLGIYRPTGRMITRGWGGGWRNTSHSWCPQLVHVQLVQTRHLQLAAPTLPAPTGHEHHSSCIAR